MCVTLLSITLTHYTCHEGISVVALSSSLSLNWRNSMPVSSSAHQCKICVVATVQKNYIQYKCAVDKWNRALLEYYRTSFFLNTDVMYTTFFMHAYTLQSWTYWKGVTSTDCRQLLFRKRLLQRLCAHLFSDPPEQALQQKHLAATFAIESACVTSGDASLASGKPILLSKCLVAEIQTHGLQCKPFSGLRIYLSTASGVLLQCTHL